VLPSTQVLSSITDCISLLLALLSLRKYYPIGQGRDIGVFNLRQRKSVGPRTTGLGLEQFQSNRRFLKRYRLGFGYSRSCWHSSQAKVSMATVSGAALVRKTLFGARSRCIYRARQPAIQKRFQTTQSSECLWAVLCFDLLL